MKHGFVTAMEDILDADRKTTHEKLATQVRIFYYREAIPNLVMICINIHHLNLNSLL